MTPLMVISSLLNCMTLVAGHEQLQLKLTTPCPFSRNPKRCGLPFSRLRLTSESSISRCHFCHTKLKLIERLTMREGSLKQIMEWIQKEIAHGRVE